MNKKLLLCSVLSPSNCIFNSCKASACFAFLYNKSIGRVGYEMKRVVVTGMGAVTPIGITVEKFWESVLEGKVGIGPIQNFDTTQYKAKLSAEVIDFDPKAYIEPKAAKRMDRFSQMAVTASIEAMQDSGLNIEEEDSYRLGVCVGSGVGSLMGIEREYDKMLAKGPGRIHPLTAPLVLGNMAAASVAMYHGFQGKCIDVVTACATGTNSIGEAFRSIQHGEADVILAGGVDSSVSRFGVAAFQALTALTDSEDPTAASIPFDKRRNGFVTGEGAGIFCIRRIRACQSKRRTYLCRDWWIRGNLRCASCYDSAGGWLCSRTCNDAGDAGCRCGSGRSGLY